MAKTDKELAVEMVSCFMERAIHRETLEDAHHYLLSLNSQRLAAMVRSAYDAIHALPDD